MAMRIIEFVKSISRKELFLFFVPHVILIALQILFFSIKVDDAFITYHYSENFAQTGELVWNIGEEPLEGYSTILLILIQTPFAAIGVNLNLFMKVLGILCGHFTLIFIGLASREVFKDAGYYYLPALLLASMPSFAVHNMSGMETSLYILIITVLLYYLAKDERNHLAISILLILVCLVRLEGLLIAGCILAYDFLKRIWKRERTIIYTVVTLAVIGAYHLFRILYFGSFLSLPTLAKRINLIFGIFDFNGITESLQFLFRFSPFIMLAIISLMYIDQLEDIHVYLMFTMLSLFLVTWLFTPIMGFEYRFLFPMMIPVLILGHKFGAKFVGFISGFTIQNLRAEKEVMQKIWKFRYLIPILFLLLYPNLRLPNAYDRMIGYSQGLDSNFELSEWLAGNATAGDVVALWDVGIVAYLTELVVLDLGGLNDKVLASGWNSTYVFMRNPRYIVLHSLSTEEYIPWVDDELDLYESDDFQDYELVRIFPISHRAHSYMLFMKT